MREFERYLQPSFHVLELDDVNCPGKGDILVSELERTNQTITFTRAFQHTALIYLYSAIRGLPARHPLLHGLP